MKISDLQRLIKKYNDGTASPDERRFVETWYEDLHVDTGKAEGELPSDLENSIFSAVEAEIGDSEQTRNPSLRMARTLFRIAAAVTVVISISIYLLFFRLAPVSNHTVPKVVSVTQNDVEAGGDRATLTLGSGARIILNELQQDSLNYGASVIRKNEEGSIRFESTGRLLPAAELLAWNTLSTPTGGQYKIVLPDGTKVWLNAESHLRFPTVFAGNERHVELVGEAYFEVSQDKSKPFRVIADKAKIEVLGTHFNVMAYKDEKSMVATLLEGSIKISSKHGEKILSPGQQALVNQTLSVKEVDTDLAVAWKNGFTLFENEDLRTIMRRIERWYDVKVIFQDHLTERRFTGGIDRKAKLSSLLKILELSDIQFELNDRILTVKK
ncbi:FecR family protein [Sphingobacterium gobiense]|uniref:FecR family protein n=1 Tax=Sphingobacterium gobiense TaxID=1382456 RepID=UPI0015E3B5C3|nr:FecR domain-containing protein [Sphingobacterium gobiense]